MACLAIALEHKHSHGGREGGARDKNMDPGHLDSYCLFRARERSEGMRNKKIVLPEPSACGHPCCNKVFYWEVEEERVKRENMVLIQQCAVLKPSILSHRVVCVQRWSPSPAQVVIKKAILSQKKRSLSNEEVLAITNS